jgi:hypothetical protein
MCGGRRDELMPTRSFFRGWGRAVLSLLIVLGGVATAVVTVLARRAADWETARAGAIAALVFVVLMLAFVVPPLARSARAEAARLDPPVQLTAGGLVFVCVFAVVAFAAWNTANNLLFVVFSAMASALFVSWTAGRSSLRDLVVTARFPTTSSRASRPLPSSPCRTSSAPLPSFSVLVEARVRAEAPASGVARLFRRGRFERRPLAYFMYVPRRAKAEQQVEQSFARRGRVRVTGFEISTKFPFGFIRLRRRLRARDVEIVVYPRARARPATSCTCCPSTPAARPPRAGARATTCTGCGTTVSTTTCGTSTGRRRPGPAASPSASSRPRTSAASTSCSTRACRTRCR